MLFAARHGSVGDFDGDRIGDYIITNENWSFVDIYRGNRQQMLMYDRTIRPVVADRGIGVDAFVGFVGLAPKPATSGLHAATSGRLSARGRTLGRAGIGAIAIRCLNRSSCLRPLNRSAAVVPSLRVSA